MVILCDKPYETPFENNPFAFELSDFQKYAIDGIIKGQHVLITAHTGSGKTLPAEFAIQHFVKTKQKKVIYTSPIKALSNQKFFEFSNKYPNISFGLLTGDIKTNPNADVLIMTTEILMNYLFSQSHSDSQPTGLAFQMDIHSELGCVIFDEVHYINDQERGQTWEQTILMLPHHIQMVMLSATIDNPQGFAEWIEQREIETPDKKSVILASTEHRVVPLTHYGFFTTTETPFKTIKDKEIQAQIKKNTNRLILLRTAGGKFSDEGYYELKSMRDLFDKNRFFMKRKFVLNQLATHLKENEMLPAIVFVFSRKAVEQCAHDITSNLLEDDSKIPYIVRRECEQIVRKFPNYREYLELPEYDSLVGLLEKGIGIHHSGMMPVLREIVELMISKKYIKMLFATESFAIGLDCPIKTAVFSALTKFDGSNHRDLMPHEYTQMAGRAGRRGIDTIGNVIHCNNLFDMPQINEYKTILCGKPQKLVSKFKIGYSTVFNIIKHFSKKDDISPTEYHEFVDRSMLKKEIEKKIVNANSEVDNLKTALTKKLESPIRTPLDVCKQYMESEANLTMYSTKKRKEVARWIQNAKEDYKWIADDVVRLRDIHSLRQSIENAESELDFLNHYSQYHIDKICKIMEETGFIDTGGNLTQKGKIAAEIREIHPLIGSHLFERCADPSVSSQEIIRILSLFSDLRVQEDFRKLSGKYREFEDLSLKYEKMELDAGAYTGIHYESMITYYLCDEIVEWSNCKTEEQCKYFIQTALVSREISLGDFIKAVLKMVVIAKEFETICEQLGDIDFLHRLREIGPLICKYVATSQSLYV